MKIKLETENLTTDMQFEADDFVDVVQRDCCKDDETNKG